MIRKSIVVDATITQCAVCGKTRELQWHHIIHGVANRKLSDKYGLTCWLCMDCHEHLHSSPDERWRDIDNQLKVAAQRKFEDQCGHDAWMQTFNKNYYDD